MLETEEISRIVGEVASANLTPTIVNSVVSQPTADSQGGEALRITIIVDPTTFPGADAVLNTLVEIQDRLRDAGEQRFPIIEYATQDEVEDGGEP